jgi:glutamate 5-kinase
MYTKVLAAKTAAKTNINTVIASGKTNDVLTGLRKYQVNNKTDKYIINILEHHH